MSHLLQSTIVAVAAGVLTLVLHRNHPRVRYWIWFASSVKFLIPFSLLVSLGSHVSWQTNYRSEPTATVFVSDGQLPSADASSSVVASTNSAPTRTFGQSLPTLMFALWVTGCAVVLVRWYLRWKRLQTVSRHAERMKTGQECDALRRLEARVGASRSITIVGSRGVMEPCVFGILRPVLVWPAALSERLEHAQLEAILLHELSHVRYRDNLIAAVHMVVETVFWFHPLVWWIGRRLVDERERACDQEVLRWGVPSQAYAEGILKVCEFGLGSRLVCAATITGSNLTKRIADIMTKRTPRRVSVTRKLLLSATGLAAVCGPVLFGAMQPRQAPQSPVAQLRFEVASLKANKSDGGLITLGCHGTDSSYTGALGIAPPPLGRCVTRRATLRMLIYLAFDLRPSPADDQYLVGGPGWIDTERYDLDAKAEGTSTEADLRQMLQLFLQERFKLSVRSETRDTAGYALIAAKDGPKLEAASGNEERQGIQRILPGPLTGRNATIERLAQTLSTQLGKPIIDDTGLLGHYNFTLVWTPGENEHGLLSQLPPGLAARFPTAVDPNGPSLFTALQEQLGLRLEARKVPIAVLIIEHAEKPTGDEAALTAPTIRIARETARSQKAAELPTMAAPRPETGLSFEVASIKPFQEAGALRGPAGNIVIRQVCHGVDSTAPGELRVPLGRCLFNNRALTDLINFAYPELRFFSLPLEKRITGGAGWVRENTFDIEAQAENPATATQAQLRQMVRTLLQERFKLAFHQTTSEYSGYALIVAPGVLKLQPSSGPGTPVLPPNGTGARPFVARNVLMSFLVVSLGELIKAPVVDQTRIEGRYNIVVNCAENGDDTAPSIFTALPQVTGLKLEPRKVTLSIVVIDHAEKPAE